MNGNSLLVGLLLALGGLAIGASAQEPVIFVGERIDITVVSVR